jgi:hypothetical protein
MHLAGVPVRDDLVLELARLVDDDHLARRLEDAYGAGARSFIAPPVDSIGFDPGEL